MERSRFLIALPFLLSLFFVFSCSFDELEEYTNTPAKGDRNISKVSAYFQVKRATINSDILFLEVDFDETGTIIEKPRTIAESFFGLMDKGLSHLSLYHIDTDFNKYPSGLYELKERLYPKNIQHFVVSSPSFEYEKILVYHPVFDQVIGQDINSLKDMGFSDVKSIVKDEGSNHFSLERTEDFGVTKVDLEIDYNTSGLPIRWREKKEFVPYSASIVPTRDAGITVSTPKEQVTRQWETVPDYESNSLKIEYNANGLPSRLIHSGLRGLGAVSDNREDEKSEMRLRYNQKNQIHEIEMYGTDGTFWYKYRLYYNEAGYCTKKELINREGSVEFSVRFEYEFF